MHNAPHKRAPFVVCAWANQYSDNNQAMELSYSGQMDGVDFGIGTNSAEFIKQWGEPARKENFMGGCYCPIKKFSFLLTEIY